MNLRKNKLDKYKSNAIRLITCLLFVSFQVFAHASDLISIHGFVRDAQTGESLIGANVFSKKHKIGTTTNGFGFFSIQLPNDCEKLSFSFIGYLPQEINSDALIGNSTVIFLTPGIEIAEVSVTNSLNERKIRDNINSVQLKMDEVKQIPSLFGECDLVKVLQKMPGVQSGGEGKSELHVRGGSPDQNLVLLDDVQLYYISHFAGIFSIFNPDAIKHVTLHKGGFQARYGGRLSSILDIRMKDGNVNRKQGNASIGLLSSRITYEGPLFDSKSTFLVSARKSILPIMKMITHTIDNRFGDLNAKLVIPITQSDNLMASIYWGNDKVINANNSFEFANQWGNKLASVRWNHVFNPRLFMNTSLSGLNYKYQTSFKFESDSVGKSHKIQSENRTGITDVQLKTDMRWNIAPRYDMHFGASTIYHQYLPNSESYYQYGDGISPFEKSFKQTQNAMESAVYFENDISYRGLGSNLGLRMVHFQTGKKSYVYFEPRILLNLNLYDNFYLNGTYCETNQFTHLLSVSTVGMPSDYWMPATENIKPQSSQQFSAGINMPFKKGKFLMTIDAYYKTMNNLVDFKDGASMYGNFDHWEDLVETNGIGYSKGIEILVKKNMGATTGWIGYTLAKSERKFSVINHGNSYPFRYDRRHDVNIVVNHRLKNSIVLSAAWNYGTGYPVTLALGKYLDALGNENLLWGDRNNFRMRDYHRLDISAQIPHKIGKLKGTWLISVLNVYNRKNPFYYFYGDKTFTFSSGSNTNGNTSNTTLIGDKGLSLYQQSLFPFLPSVSYSFAF